MDLALIVFDGEVPLGHKTASFNPDQQPLDEGEEVVIAGYGKDEVNVSSFRSLLKANSNIIELGITKFLDDRYNRIREQITALVVVAGMLHCNS